MTRSLQESALNVRARLLRTSICLSPQAISHFYFKFCLPNTVLLVIRLHVSSQSQWPKGGKSPWVKQPPIGEVILSFREFPSSFWRRIATYSIDVSILGLTGAGKSTVRAVFLHDLYHLICWLQFINNIAGSEVATVGHDLQSCTSTVRPITIPYPSHDDPTRRVIFVDTPGFNDTWVDDTKTLREIVDWLEQS